VVFGRRQLQQIRKKKEKNKTMMKKRRKKRKRRKKKQLEGDDGDKSMELHNTIIGLGGSRGL
jgi:hypothetical protein